MTKSSQFSEHNTQSYLDFLFIDEVLLSAIVHMEDIPWKMCESGVPRKSSIFFFSLY